mmetsp:Transcript_1337/g.3997  ORF Transcript_1337/g.3997 Transcript_1337/m.3997 type:complete len:758 (-) Transcript_1337:479-2752(-)
MSSVLRRLSPSQKRVLALALIVGGGTGAKFLRGELRKAAREQAKLAVDVDSRPANKKREGKKNRVAVDRVFLKRLGIILKICVPSLWSREAVLIAVQSSLLMSRTWLTDYISRIEARAGRHLIGQNFPEFFRLLAAFAGVAIPAAVVNSGLKYVQKRIQLAFMRRLSHNLHEHYTTARAYYAASTLGGLTNADQRITEDVEKFSFAIADLFSYTFKPLLDVILFTRSLSRIMGYKGQVGLYAYYLATAAGLRAMSPALALMTAQETHLSGSFRAAHQRLVASAEEVAFNNPPSGAAERMILNRHLERVLRHSRLSALQRFVQGILDGYLIKYGATLVALLVYAAPMYARGGTRQDQGDVTQDYIRAMRLLQNTSRGVGDLVLVYKRVTALAGHTSRVAELLESVNRLSAPDAAAYHEQLYIRNVSSSNMLAAALEDEEAEDEIPPPARHDGRIIRFDRVALNAPDGTRLVRQLTFDVPVGRSIMIMGPNGSGKSSLFRVLAGLWPLQGGEVTLPPARQLFYLSQRPYLVAGSLRDQLTYPRPPAAVWAAASPASKRAFVSLPGPGAGSDLDKVDQDAEDLRLEECLEAVGLDYLLGRGSGWEQLQPWTETLSGGEKQRLAMARVLFHKPAYAILDECTSAVSADGETALYGALHAAGITLLSIAHRPALRAFHNAVIHFEGGQLGSDGSGWSVEELAAPPTYIPAAASDASSELYDDEPEGQAATAESEEKFSALEGLTEADSAVAADDGKNGLDPQ